ECLHHLIHTVTRDGNYLLNVGPTGAGEIEARQIDLLQQVGNWIGKYERTIYGTRGGPFLPGEWGGATYAENNIYLHITSWPENTLVLSKWKQPVVAWRGLNVNGIDVIETDTHIIVTLAVEERDPIDTIVELRLEQPIEWEGVQMVENDVYG